MQGKAVALLAGSLLALSCALPAGAQLGGRPNLWDVEALAAQATGPTVDFTRQGALVAQVPLERVRGLVDAKQRLEAASGVFARLMLTDAGGRAPNAFATRSRQGTLVALNLAMLELMGDDVDALAAILGHEIAHLALHHGEIRREREQVMEGLGTILGLALAGRRHARTAMRVTQFGTTAISRGFSRDEERAADEHGLRYAAAAGYSAQGGVRAWERMAARGNSINLPFLATHPATEERLQSMRMLASAMPDAPREGIAAEPAQVEDERASIGTEHTRIETERAEVEAAPAESATTTAAQADDGLLGVRAIADAPEWPPAGIWKTRTGH
jgi:Zn-dependent protease with chaperone function